MNSTIRSPPKASFTPESVQHHYAAIPFGIDTIVSAAWSLFKTNLGTCLWVVWAVMMLNMGIGFVLGIVQAGVQAAMPGDQASNAVVAVAVNVISMIVGSWLGIGMNLGLLKIVRGEPVSFEVLFSGGRYLVTVIGEAIVLALLLFAVMLVPIGGLVAALVGLRDQPGIGFAATMIFIVLFIGVMIYGMARLMQFYFLIIDQDAGVVDSIQPRGH